MQGRLTASESIQDCRSRAAQAAEFILSSIGDKREAALMGHGFFNHLLTQALADRGWQSISSGRGYWSVNHLSKT
jgi:hypothetical protein